MPMVTFFVALAVLIGGYLVYSRFFIMTLVCPDNWYFKPLCVRTIGDTIRKNPQGIAKGIF